MRAMSRDMDFVKSALDKHHNDMQDRLDADTKRRDLVQSRQAHKDLLKAFGAAIGELCLINFKL